MISIILYLMSIILICPICLIIALMVYFLPSIIAYLRKHSYLTPIIILNATIGWTFLGWFAALFWALNSDTSKEEESTN